jgi:hypothetical protein
MLTLATGASKILASLVLDGLMVVCIQTMNNIGTRFDGRFGDELVFRSLSMQFFTFTMPPKAISRRVVLGGLSILSNSLSHHSF